jgi:ketosteroid isomerase-like protein
MDQQQETPGQHFYQRQLKALAEKDIDTIVDQYQPDAQVIGFAFQVQGSEAIRKHFVAYVEQLGSLDLLSTDKWAETGDSIFFEATVNTAYGTARVYDVFVLRDGKATHHFTGLLSFTPFEQSGPA